MKSSTSLRPLGFYVSLMSQIRWSMYLKLVVTSFIVLIFSASFITDLQMRRTIRDILTITLLFSLCAKEWIDTPANWQRVKQVYRESESLFLACVEFIPVEFRGWIKTFFLLQKASIKKPSFNDTTANSYGSVSYLNNGMYTSLLPIFIVAALGDIPFSLLLVHLFGINGSASIIIHIITITATLLTISSLMGDKRLLGDGVHQIKDSVLLLRLGARVKANIPLTHILNAELIDQRKLPLLDTDLDSLHVTPFDKVNLTLHLNSTDSDQQNMWFEEWGSRRTGIRTVHLYVDVPEKLIAALSNTNGTKQTRPD